MTGADRAYIYPTDRKWTAFLRDRPHITEANFWTPSGATFKNLQRNQRFLFKSKAADGGQLIGGGLFSHFDRSTVSMAWQAFGEGNGVATHEELLAAVNSYRHKQGHAPHPDPEIGCIMLHGVFFAPQFAGIDPPADYKAAGATRGRSYRPVDIGWAHLESAFENLAWRSGTMNRDPHPELAGWIGGATVSDVRLVERRHRLGQGEFRVRVAASYSNRCAITGSKVTLALDAAHVQSVSSGGEHRLDNGLLLRTDVHRLFDAGYLGMDEKHRLEVSPRLRADFGNGDEFYSREHQELVTLPQRPEDRPRRESIEWHMDTVFKSA